MTDQEFLNQALQHAEDEQEKKLVLLRYQQAMFQTLHAFQPCDACATTDLTLFKKRAEKLLAKTERYLVAVLPLEEVATLMKESRTLFGEVAQLCPTCQARIQRDLLAAFRAAYTPR